MPVASSSKTRRAPSSEVTGAQRIGLFFALAILFFSVYGIIGALQVSAELHELETFIDRAIPFSSGWMLIYGGLYPVVLAPLAIVSHRRVALRGALGICIVVGVGVPFWLFFPVTVPRPPVAVEGVLSWGVLVVRYIDPPTNCFPSMHVAEAAFASLLVWRHDRKWGSAVLGLTLAIWYSSIALDQHWFVDGLAGVGLAIVVDHFVYRGLAPSAFASRDRRWHLFWIGAYVLLFVAFASPWWFGWIDPSQLVGRWQP